MSHPILPPGSAAADRIDHLCVVALTRELGPYWSPRDLVGRVNASIESHSRYGIFRFTLFLDSKVILSETITPAEVAARAGCAIDGMEGLIKAPPGYAESVLEERP